MNVVFVFAVFYFHQNLNMKSTKKQKCTSAPEDCGVWLDASELRAKKLQKQVRPISKLLNPLARAGGYSTAVALNFTQTRMQMPVTRQSTISSFFVPQSKTSKDPEDCSSSHLSWMSSTPLPQTLTGTKRKHEKFFQSTSESDILLNKAEMQTPQVSAELESESGRISADTSKEQQFLHLIWGYQSEEPAENKRPENSMIENVTKQEDDETFSHGFKDSDELVKTNRTRNDSWALLFEEDCHSTVPLKTRTVIPKKPDILSQELMKPPFRSQEGSKLGEHFIQASRVVRKDKENRRPNNTEFSPGKHLRPVWNSPAKQNLQLKTKSGQTLKSTRHSVLRDEDSLARLFTQDSEGFEVIANRSQWSRCPLNDQTNSYLGRDYFNISSVRSCDTENCVEPEMLFTQDSQGNMVIKH